MARRRRPPPRPDDAPPRSEAEWEAEFRRMDLVAGRFGELLETLIDDPDRHEKIAHEMGWDDEDEEDEDDDDPERAAWREEMEQITNDAVAEVEREKAEAQASGRDPFEDDEADDRRAERDAVPAYAAASDLGERVMELLKDRADAGDEDVDELFARALMGVLIAGAKLSKGHGFGYEDDVLCGNIVCCKQALAGATDGRAAWGELRDRGLMPRPVADEIVDAHDAVVGLIEARIAELRARVWW
jgi:hypothetical protein